MRDGKQLILFDIDGTLLSCGPQVRTIFRGAMQAVFGCAGDLDGYDFAGKTDDGIVVDLLTGAGVAGSEIAAGLPAMRREYVERLDRELEGDRMRLMPGVTETLERLSAGGETLLGLLTGNWEGGAGVKLGRLGLARYFRFGAFGDGTTDRRSLPPLALARAAEVRGRPFTSAETLIVGDTVLDVACGRAHGIQVLAVATGGTSAEELERAGADWVCQNLGEPEARTP